MSKTRNLSDLLDANGDVKSSALDNVPSPNLTGIDDNADATAITIDSSENVHIGKTARADNTVGHSLQADGLAVHTRDDAELLFLNRKTSDGKIISVRKDNTEEGNIGVSGGDMYIASSTSGHKGFRFGNGAIVPTTTSGGTDDNATTLGGATQRFANLYLGGNIYLGGTGSANALDDYETGTFDFDIFIDGGDSGSSGGGTYEKIGNLVTLSCAFRRSGYSTPTGAVTIDGSLPFTPLTGFIIKPSHRALNFSGDAHIKVNGSNTTMYTRTSYDQDNSDSNNEVSTSDSRTIKVLEFTVSYLTA